MITREKLAEEIKKVPDERLEELYRAIKDLEQEKGPAEAGQSVMARLRDIKISASPDFSIEATLYRPEQEDAK